MARARSDRSTYEQYVQPLLERFDPKTMRLQPADAYHLPVLPHQHTTHSSQIE